MIEHHIQTGDTKPIKLPPYRVLQAMVVHTVARVCTARKH